ncbi:hypothetical protein P3W45_001194 [Vairimorpha bombi]|jgi:transcription initiation factor TFIID subunit 7
MEQHFILRLSDELKDKIDLTEASLESIDTERVQLTYRNKTYPGIVVKLPCIVESQKTLDKKQYYKVNDISTMIVIYPDNNFDIVNERRMLELSGLTAPLKYAKARRFRKNITGKIHLINEIEQKVNELLEKDKRAKKVELEGVDIAKESVDDDILEIVAEIENNLEPLVIKEELIISEPPVDTPEIIELKKEIHQQENLVKNALNPILQQRFKAKLDSLREKLNKLYKQ